MGVIRGERSGSHALRAFNNVQCFTPGEALLHARAASALKTQNLFARGT